MSKIPPLPSIKPTASPAKSNPEAKAASTAKPNTPADIARETIKQLALKRLPPTPENYQKVYGEITGEPSKTSAPSDAAGPNPELLIKILQDWGMEKEDESRFRHLLGLAQKAQDWQRWVDLFAKESLRLAHEKQHTESWATLLRDLIKQWDLRQTGLTSGKKKEALERVLTNFGHDAGVLNEKLNNLVRSWAEGNSTPDIETEADQPATETAGSEAAASASPAQTSSIETASPSGNETVADSLKPCMNLLAQTLRLGLAPRLKSNAKLAEEAETLAQQVLAIQHQRELPLVQENLRRYWLQLELQVEQEDRLTDGLLRVLRLLMDNMSDLMLDETWVQGQIAMIQNLIQSPVSMQEIYTLEMSMRHLMLKQGNIKQGLKEAKDTLKNMISTFINRLGTITSSTGSYHDKISHYANLMERTDDLHQLNDILQALMNDTKTMQLDMLRTKDELEEAHRQAQEAEARIAALEQELEQVSERVRHDQLTGALNRRGLSDAIEKEVARVERSDSPLCLALLDVDNFKHLNDQLGHQAGDAALIHLVKVVQDGLRPTDVVARYGGEEFVILLPNTGVEEATQVLQRLQRELTKRFFMHNNERRLITFSAGLTPYQRGEPEAQVVNRADSAMYQAKRSGKNRVVVANAQGQVLE